MRITNDTYVAYAESLKRFIAQWTKDTNTINDVCQEAFTQALKHAPNIRNAYPYLRQTAKHILFNQHSRNRRVFHGLCMVENLTDPCRTPDVIIEQLDMLENVLAGLSTSERKVLQSVLDGDPGDVAAHKLGCSAAAYRVRAYRLLKRLRETL